MSRCAARKTGASDELGTALLWVGGSGRRCPAVARQLRRPRCRRGGQHLVAGAGHRGRVRPGRQVLDSDRISSFNVFSGTEIASHSAEFKGGNIGAVFGGAEIDLRDARLAPGAALDVFAAFGGGEIRGPDGWPGATGG